MSDLISVYIVGFIPYYREDKTLKVAHVYVRFHRRPGASELRLRVFDALQASWLKAQWLKGKTAIPEPVKLSWNDRDVITQIETEAA